MFIKRLYAKSYKGLNNLEVNFHRANSNQPLQISVMVGDNGIGKSSLLQLLADVFCPVQRSTQEKPSPHFEISYEITAENNSSSIVKKIVTSPHAVSFTHENGFPDHYPSKLIVSSYSAFDPYQVTYAMRRHKQTPFKESAYVYCGPNERNYSSLETAINAVIRANLSSDTRVWEGYQKLFRKIGYGELLYCELAHHRIPKFKEAMERSLKNELITIELFSQFEHHMEEFRILRRNYNNSAISRTKTIVPFEAINPALLEILIQSELFDAPPIIKDLWFKSPTGTEVPLSEFSSGELTMLYRFLPLVLEIETNSVILIDEPETHLHPRWAQEFVEYLDDLFGGFKAHIILATHSPIIISDVPTENLVILDKHDGIISQRLPIDRTFGATSTDILKDVFFMKQMSGNQSAEVLNRIEKQLSSGEQSQVNEARQLFLMLSTTFEKYELFQKYKKQLGD